MTDEAGETKGDEAPGRAAELSHGEPAVKVEETDDLVFETLWGRVVEAWEDDKPHGAILDYALRAHRLPELAGRYRALVDDAAKGARARKKVDGIVVAATQMMLLTKTPKREKPPSYLTWTAFFVFVLVMGLLWYAMAPKR